MSGGYGMSSLQFWHVRGMCTFMFVDCVVRKLSVYGTAGCQSECGHMRSQVTVGLWYLWCDFWLGVLGVCLLYCVLSCGLSCR